MMFDSSFTPSKYISYFPPFFIFKSSTFKLVSHVILILCISLYKILFAYYIITLCLALTINACRTFADWIRVALWKAIFVSQNNRYRMTFFFNLFTCFKVACFLKKKRIFYRLPDRINFTIK